MPETVDCVSAARTRPVCSIGSRTVGPGSMRADRAWPQVPNLRSSQSQCARQEDVRRHRYFIERTLRTYSDHAGVILDRVVHTKDMFGDSGPRILRLGLTRTTDRSTEDHFEMYSVGRRERFRRWSIMATCCTKLREADMVSAA